MCDNILAPINYLSCNIKEGYDYYDQYQNQRKALQAQIAYAQEELDCLNNIRIRYNNINYPSAQYPGSLAEMTACMASRGFMWPRINEGFNSFNKKNYDNVKGVYSSNIVNKYNKLKQKGWEKNGNHETEWVNNRVSDPDDSEVQFLERIDHKLIEQSIKLHSNIKKFNKMVDKIIEFKNTIQNQIQKINLAESHMIKGFEDWYANNKDLNLDD